MNNDNIKLQIRVLAYTFGIPMFVMGIVGVWWSLHKGLYCALSEPYLSSIAGTLLIWLGYGWRDVKPK